MITSSDEAAQAPFAMVHLNRLAPVPRPVTSETGLFGFAIEPLPLMRVHVPFPTRGVFPAKFVEVAHIVWSGPALETVGTASRVIVTSSEEGGQKALVMVQRNTLGPIPRFETSELGERGFPNVPAPLMRVHWPVPTEGIFPASEVEFKHTVLSGPAFAVVERVITTSSEEKEQGPFLIVHRKIFIPGARFETTGTGLEGELKVPEPETTVQVPFPKVGVFPLSVVEELQTYLSGPALGMVGFLKTTIFWDVLH
jgi:hypothetical protein